jgi:methylglutaconyl-CoA hydratase
MTDVTTPHASSAARLFKAQFPSDRRSILVFEHRINSRPFARTARLRYARLMSEQSSPVKIERHGAVGVLIIDRADRRNALSRDTLYALGRLGRELVDDPDIRAIVLTGAGDKAFCAGADLKERQNMTTDEVRKQVGLYRTELAVLDHSPKPVIAAINGVALGGGLELALICDLRVASPQAEFSLPETSLGIIPGAGGTQRLPRLIGEARAKQMILLSRRFGAAEALSWGLINRISPLDTPVLEDTIAWIEPIAQGAPIAQRAALEAVDASFDVSLDRGLELERVYYDETLRSEDRVEALKAFAEKRRPVFKGI